MYIRLVKAKVEWASHALEGKLATVNSPEQPPNYRFVHFTPLSKKINQIDPSTSLETFVIVTIVIVTDMFSFQKQ